jgi:hypothetical protein
MTTTAKQVANIDRLKARIQALRTKPVQNGCTEQEAVTAAAAKVAEFLDQYDLSLSNVEIREEPCKRAVVETCRRQRVPLNRCLNAIAAFCDCGVWLKKNSHDEHRHVFFDLSPNVAIAYYSMVMVILTDLEPGSMAGHSAVMLWLRITSRHFLFSAVM